MVERKPASVGEILLEEFIIPLNLTHRKLADLLQVSLQHLSDVIAGSAKLSIDFALRLSRVFGNTLTYWLNLQLKTDLWKARTTGNHLFNFSV